MIIRFAVTKEDIDQGEQESESNCPIARAIRRCFPIDYLISVGEVIRVTHYTDSFFEADTCYYDYPLDGMIDRFIHAFDSGLDGVHPFEIEIELKEA